jgi:hypothetical protein
MKELASTPHNSSIPSFLHLSARWENVAHLAPLEGLMRPSHRAYSAPRENWRADCAICVRPDR